MQFEVLLPDISYSFSALDERDFENWRKLQTLLELNEDPFGRGEDHGHVTASALIVNEDRDHILLVHHAKLGLWLPPGGHCDSDSNLVRVCQKEVFEETGHSSIVAITDRIFDIDIHTIPACSSSREHLHYDVRFAFEANISRPLVISNESKDVLWIPIDRLQLYTSLPSILVLTQKLAMI